MLLICGALLLSGCGTRQDLAECEWEVQKIVAPWPSDEDREIILTMDCMKAKGYVFDADERGPISELIHSRESWSDWWWVELKTIVRLAGRKEDPAPPQN